MDRRHVLRGIGASLIASTVGSGATLAAKRQSEPYEPLGSVSINGAREAVVGDDGETAYVATTDGYAVVDVSDPTAPSVLAEDRDLVTDHPDGPLTEILDVAIDGDRLIVAGPANAIQGVVYGFLLYDVSDPASPEQIGDFTETEFPIHNAYLENEYAYLTGNVTGGPNPYADLVVVDVSDDPAEEVGRWSPPDHDDAWDDVHPYLYNIHDVYVQDEMAYVAFWDGGTYLLDVSDPASPEYVTHVSRYEPAELADATETEEMSNSVMAPPGNDHYAMPNDDGSLLAVGRESWAPDADTEGPSGIDLYDVSGSGDPDHLATIDPPETDDPTRSGTWTTSHNFDVVGDRLYSSWYQGGVKVHDISEPSNPEEIAWWLQPDEAAFWTAKLAPDRDFFVSTSTELRETEGGLYTFPDRAGEQDDRPSIVASNAGGSETETDTETDTETAIETETVTDTETETATDAGTDDGDELPGFGAGTALVGLGAGVAAVRRRLDGTDED